MVTAPSSPTPLALPRLSPGLRVVARGRDRLQVGLYAGRRLVLDRTPEVERVLRALTDFTPLDTDGDPTAAEVLDRLGRAGALVWQDALALASAQAPVAVLGSLPGVDCADLLARTGMRAADAVESPSAVVVLSSGELARELLDPLLRKGVEHIVVRLVDGGAVVGPYVVPGLTACLRCIDAHLAEHDPAHVEVMTRYVRATSRVRNDGAPEAADPFVATIATAWALRDLRARLAGGTPSTWSATLHLDAAPARHETRTWLRHPRCGCTWSNPEVSSGTMEA